MPTPITTQMKSPKPVSISHKAYYVVLAVLIIFAAALAVQYTHREAPAVTTGPLQRSGPLTDAERAAIVASFNQTAPPVVMSNAERQAIVSATTQKNPPKTLTQEQREAIVQSFK